MSKAISHHAVNNAGGPVDERSTGTGPQPSSGNNGRGRKRFLKEFSIEFFSKKMQTREKSEFCCASLQCMVENIDPGEILPVFETAL